MVAVIRCPSEGKFGEVSGANNESIQLVGKVHQNLCPFASLRVFVGGVVDFSVVTNVGEMLFDGLRNRNLHLRNTQCLH